MVTASIQGSASCLWRFAMLLAPLDRVNITLDVHNVNALTTPAVKGGVGRDRLLKTEHENDLGENRLLKTEHENDLGLLSSVGTDSARSQRRIPAEVGI